MMIVKLCSLANTITALSASSVQTIFLPLSTVLRSTSDPIPLKLVCALVSRGMSWETKVESGLFAGTCWRCLGSVCSAVDEDKSKQEEHKDPTATLLTTTPTLLPSQKIHDVCNWRIGLVELFLKRCKFCCCLLSCSMVMMVFRPYRAQQGPSPSPIMSSHHLWFTFYYLRSRYKR